MASADTISSGRGPGEAPPSHTHFSLALPRIVARTVRRHGLIERGDRVLVAVSDGPDSVALLSLLASWAPSWGFTLQAAHVNHGLRGAESEEDAEFVRALCERLGVGCVSERVPLTTRGTAGGQIAAVGRRHASLQEYARELRYAALARMAERCEASKIALGHTVDDQAETLLMWMLRGSGAGGLAGIPPVRERRFIRPLLEVQRADVLAYLGACGLQFRTDSTNAKPLYLRNRIRHELLPVLRRFNPGIVAVLKRQADILREEHLYLNQVAEEQVARVSRRGPDQAVVLDRQALLSLPTALQRRVVRAVMQGTTRSIRGPSFATVETVLKQVVHGRSGATVVAGGVQAVREYDWIRFRAPAAQPHATPAWSERGLALPLVVPSETVWPLTGRAIRLHWEEGAAERGSINRVPGRAELDPAKFTSELALRSWRPGDRFQPLGMGGRHKKLQDFFADLKIPRRERSRVPLLVAPEGILWVVGYRTDHRFCAHSSSGRRLVAEVADGPSLQEESR